jgi:hypothetical protein
MRTLYDVHLDGPFQPATPRDPYARSVLNAAEYGEDAQTEHMVHALLVGLPRPLTYLEKRATANDSGRPTRVYAPAAARVSKDPAWYDAEILEAGRRHEITPEAARHPGDRSDPAELR